MKNDSESELEYELETDTESEPESENADSASRSGIAWRWTIEALASSEKVSPSLLHDVIEKAEDLPEDERESPWEMVALKCLESLFGSLNSSGENGPPSQESKVVFDSSESCERVLKHIYAETPKSALRVAGPEMAKWDVKPFIAQKRASMRCSLHKLRDSILDGTHPYADFLMTKSGMTPANKRDAVSISNEGGIELCRSDDSSSSDSYADFLMKKSGETPVNRRDDISLNNEGGIELGRRRDSGSADPYADFLMKTRELTPINKRDGIALNNVGGIESSRRHDSSSSSSDSRGHKEKGKGSPLLQDERRISAVNASSSCLLPSKRSAVESTSEDEARQLPGCDDGYANAKKLKQHSAHTLYSEQEVDSPHGTEMLEDLPERIVPRNERNDTDPLDEDLVDDKLAREKRIGPEMSGQSSSDESGISCYVTPDRTQDGEVLEVIGVEKVKDGSELPCEPKTSNNSLAEGNLHDIITDGPKPFPAEGNLHDVITNDPEPSPAEGNLYDIITDDPEHGFGNDNHVNEINTSIDVGMNANEEEKDMLSDSDGYHNEMIDIAMKKNELLSSQCMVDYDSSPLADRSELTVCVKCNEEGGQLLSCNMSGCPMVVHDKCLSSSAGMNDEGDFCCPFCLYSLAISKYLEAKKHAALAKKNVATFIRTGFGHQSIVIKEVLQQQDLDPSRKAGIEDIDQICDNVDLENEDNQVTLYGEHVNEVVDHQATTVTEEQIIELSKPLHIANSDHRENEASPLVAPDVLSGEKDGDELVEQECQGNTVAELVDQECQRNVAELEDGQKAAEQHDTLHEDQASVEAVAMQEGLHYQTDDNEEEPTYAINNEGEKSIDDDNDESIISRYSLRFRRKYHHSTSMCPETHQSRRKKVPWTAEEEEILKEGVREFSSSVERSPKIPWKKILEFGCGVFLQDRSPVDLQNKWRNLCRSPKKD